MTELNLFTEPTEDLQIPVNTKPKTEPTVLPIATPPEVKEHLPVQVVNLEIPIPQPKVDISGQQIDEAFDVMDDVLEMAEDVLPPSLQHHVSWFKRKLMWFKRKYKKYRVWWHKLGKLELDPKIRADFRAQRQQTSTLFKRINDALGELETQRKRFEDAEQLANTAQEALKELQNKTSMMR